MFTTRLRRIAFLLLAAMALALPLTAAPAVAAQTPAVSMVPLRALSEAAGAEVTWDQATWTATVTLGDRSFSVTIGKAEAAVAGQAAPMGQAAALVESRTMVPLTFLGEALDAHITLDPATGKATVDPVATAARRFTRQLLAGKVAGLADRLSPTLRTMFPEAMLPAAAAQLAPLGPLQQLAVVGQSTTAVHRNVELIAVYKPGAVKVMIRYTPDGQVDDFHINNANPVLPAGEPAYADASKYTETEVVLGTAPWQLPGTLTMPAGEGPFPAVVLVHGSGPQDRDETTFGVKPFRDLAHGLASKGVAVLRYDKRTFVHSQKLGANILKLTIQEETVADALAAVKVLAGTKGIDPARIYVLGHSQGGAFAPRILAQDTAKQIAGGILMGAPADFGKALVDQNKIMAQQGLLPAAQVEFVTAQVAMLQDPSFDPAKPPQGFALGIPAYWADFRGRSAEPLKDDARPLLILQGARDFQVPADQLDLWLTDLGEGRNVVSKLYPKLNHAFTEGEGPMSALAEYAVPANIPLYVIDDIAGWILK